MAEPDLLNIREVAELLRVGDKTIYTLVQNGELPGFKVGGQWRFKRSDIDTWIETQKKAASGADELQVDK